MKKYGFTLAEILITLGIVGIIAALTIPGLTRNVSQKSIGPALAKAVNNIAAANSDALRATGYTRLSQMTTGGTGKEDYTEVLKTYLDGIMRETNETVTIGTTTEPATIFYGVDGTSYAAVIGLKKGDLNSKYVASNKYKGEYWEVVIDINGKKGSGTPGYEKFVVYVDDYGSVILGGSATAKDYGVTDAPSGNGGDNYYCDKNPVNEYCTQHVARNGWQVTY